MSPNDKIQQFIRAGRNIGLFACQMSSTLLLPLYYVEVLQSIHSLMQPHVSNRERAQRESLRQRLAEYESRR
jgi:hypothetical protein